MISPQTLQERAGNIGWRVWMVNPDEGGVSLQNRCPVCLLTGFIVAGRTPKLMQSAVGGSLDSSLVEFRLMIWQMIFVLNKTEEC